MNGRPRIKIQPGATDKAVETLCWILTIALVIFSAIAYTTLPDTIPTHFNISGEVDAHGDKSTLWILPASAILIFILLSVVSRYPHAFNYPFEITEANAEFQYRNAILMLRVLKLIMVIIFSIITGLVFCTAKGWVSGMGILPVILVTTLPIIPIIFFLIRMKKGQ